MRNTINWTWVRGYRWLRMAYVQREEPDGAVVR